MDQTTAASVIQGSDYDFLHFRALCQLEPVVNMLRTRDGVPAKQVERLRLFLEILCADDAANARRFGTRRRDNGWARNRAAFVLQDFNTLVLLGLCLTRTDLGDYGHRRLVVLLAVARALGHEACCQPVFQDSAVTSVCEAFRDRLGASTEIILPQRSPSAPTPSSRMDMHAVFLQPSTPSSSMSPATDTRLITRSHIDLTLPPIVMPPRPTLSLSHTSSVPTFPKPQGECPGFQLTPWGLAKVYTVTCTNQHLLPFVPGAPTIAVFRNTGRDEYRYEMAHVRYGRYDLCLTKNGVQRLEATPLDGDRFMIAAPSLQGALKTGTARSIVFRNVGCTMVDEDVYIIWKHARILLFLRECRTYQFKVLSQLMALV